MSYPVCRTTVEQHTGNHPSTGLRCTELHEVRTDLSAHGDKPAEKLSPAEREWWDDVTRAHHEIAVMVAELDVDIRHEVRLALAELDCELEDYPSEARKVIAEATA